MDVADYLRERVQLACHACRGVPSSLLWGGWGSYGWTHDLRVSEFYRGGEEIHWRHPWEEKGLVVTANIRPTGELDNKKIEEIPTGEPKIVDGVTVDASNWNGIAPLPINYDAGFGSMQSKEEAVAIGFTEGVKVGIKFQEGGEAAFFKAEQSLEITSESRQDQTKTNANSSSELRNAGFAPTCPPGYDIEFHMSRTTQPTKLRVTGNGQLTHSLAIGKHWSGHWKKKHGKGGKYYLRHAQWDAFEDFLSVIKGEGRRDLALADWFKRNPASKWLVDRLSEPLDVPYSAETPSFDGWTKLKPHQKVIRGPNPKIVAMLHAQDEREEQE